MECSKNRWDTSYQRYLTGLRINSRRIDAAGLQVSKRLHSQVMVWIRRVDNANDGIFCAQTAEGALRWNTKYCYNVCVRVSITQSANGVNSDSDRKALQQEVGAIHRDDPYRFRTLWCRALLMDVCWVFIFKFGEGLQIKQSVLIWC